MFFRILSRMILDEMDEALRRTNRQLVIADRVIITPRLVTFWWDSQCVWLAAR